MLPGRNVLGTAVRPLRPHCPYLNSVGMLPREHPNALFGYPLRLLARRGLAYALNLTEETMHLTINTSGKEERVGWTSSCVIAKLQSPQTIDHNWISSVTFKLT